MKVDCMERSGLLQLTKVDDKGVVKGLRTAFVRTHYFHKVLPFATRSDRESSGGCPLNMRACDYLWSVAHWSQVTS
jgi:hypothetical protein